MFEGLTLIKTLNEVDELEISPDNRLFSATHDEIIRGLTTDIYFVKTREILHGLGLLDTPVVAEVFASGSGGVLAGVPEVKNLLAGRNVEVWSLSEGDSFHEKEVVMRIIGTYEDFGIYETALLGVLASSSGWATASRRIKDVVGNKTMFSFGARHVHPSVASVMERAAIIGGADGASSILGAKLAGQQPNGTVPHAVFLIVGDTIKVAKAYKEMMPSGSPVIILVDTFRDEAEEALRVADALGKDLHSIRLDTPSERGGVTPGLIREIRERLNQAGHPDVRIIVSGGLTIERIPSLIEAGADAFGVGSYISNASPIDMTMDLKEINGQPIAKRGRIPGKSDSPRLQRIL